MSLPILTAPLQLRSLLFRGGGGGRREVWDEAGQGVLWAEAPLLGVTLGCPFVMKLEPEAEVRESLGALLRNCVALPANGETLPVLGTGGAKAGALLLRLRANPVHPISSALGSASYSSIPHHVPQSLSLGSLCLPISFSTCVSCEASGLHELLKLQLRRVVSLMQCQAHLHPGLHVGGPVLGS